jgi:hypothetical protein
MAETGWNGCYDEECVGLEDSSDSTEDDEEEKEIDWTDLNQVIRLIQSTTR